MSHIDADRTETLKALADDAPRLLPPESLRTLAYLRAGADDVLEHAKAEPWAQLPRSLRLTREGVIDFCLGFETRAATDALRAHMKTPFLDGAQLIFWIN